MWMLYVNAVCQPVSGHPSVQLTLLDLPEVWQQADLALVWSRYQSPMDGH